VIWICSILRSKIVRADTFYFKLLFVSNFSDWIGSLSEKELEIAFVKIQDRLAQIDIKAGVNWLFFSLRNSIHLTSQDPLCLIDSSRC
jgi:hypothetical protein